LAPNQASSIRRGSGFHSGHWSRPGLTQCTGRKIESELTRCEKFLNNTFGVTGKPLIRPPYGARNKFVDRVAVSLGYTSITTWYGTLGDSGHISETTLLNLANQWIQSRRLSLSGTPVIPP